MGPGPLLARARLPLSLDLDLGRGRGGVHQRQEEVAGHTGKCKHQEDGEK